MKTKPIYLESNLCVMRDDKNVTLTISGKKEKNSHISDIIAFDNSGNEVHLSLYEERAANDLLLKWGKKIL